MIGVLVSGEGTNLQALLDAGLPVVAVASNRAAVPALARAPGVGGWVIVANGVSYLGVVGSMLAMRAHELAPPRAHTAVRFQANDSLTTFIGLAGGGHDSLNALVRGQDVLAPVTRERPPHRCEARELAGVIFITTTAMAS